MGQKTRVTKELIQEEFKKDQLFLNISTSEELKDKLFPIFLEKMYVEDQYSTKKAADLISESLEKASDNNIRYYMRASNLESYIQPLQMGRNYRLLYTSIYKIYLIFLYLSATDETRNLNDVKNLLPEYSVQPLLKGRKSDVVNETSLEEKRASDEHFEVAMMAMLYSKKNKNDIDGLGEVVSDLWNAYITNVQLTKNMDEINRLKDCLIIEEKKLNDLNITLSNLKNKLRSEAQFKNIQKLYGELKTIKQENSSFLGRLFSKSKKQDEDDELFTIKSDDPQVIALQDNIKEQEKIILGIQDELKLLHETREKIGGLDKVDIERMNELMVLIRQEPELNDLSEYESLKVDSNEPLYDGAMINENIPSKNKREFSDAEFTDVEKD